MNIRLWVILICGLVVYNIYYETNIFKHFNSFKKYYKIGIVVIFGLGALKIINSSPKIGYDNMKTLHQFIQFLPMDKNSKDMLTPLFSTPLTSNLPTQSIQRLHKSGKSTKRCVSETKKKYVASLQQWKCNKCKNQLTAWYEVDHKIRLEHGGTNELNNLEALCRECHGQKTAMENL
uniref:HNH nuclease domain-containing protein n=1 Tax=viral metagenome TaxID=1070528 RepID=A0A6C0KKB4_9ZZZZ